jgi:hypothetical protein
MKSRGTGQPVTLIVGKDYTTGEVTIERWDGRARLLRAAKRWAVLWAFAAVSILVPVAHFVLVPGLIIAGPIAAFMRWRQHSGVLGGEGTCPACRKPMTIDAHADEWPLFEICEACRAAVRVEKREAAL